MMGIHFRRKFRPMKFAPIFGVFPGVKFLYAATAVSAVIFPAEIPAPGQFVFHGKRRDDNNVETTDLSAQILLCWARSAYFRNRENNGPSGSATVSSLLRR
jgi:hypothetical protein